MIDKDKNIPPLRSDVTWEESPVPGDDSFRLFDALLGRQIKVTSLGRQMATYLDQPQSRNALHARLNADEQGISFDEMNGVLDHFETLQLFESDALLAISQRWEKMLARFRKDPASVPLVIPPGLRFECSCCGSCCSGVNISPVTPDILAGLEGPRFDALSKNPRCHGELFVSLTTDKAEGEVVLCPSRNGRCIFVDADGLCEIHRRFGSAAKPHICRTFPFLFTLTPSGIEVSLQTECRDLLTASQGTLLSERESELREILAHAEVVVTRPFISLDRTSRVSFDAYRELRDHIISTVANMHEVGLDLAVRVMGIVRETMHQDDLVDLSADGVATRFYRLLMGIGQSIAALRSEPVSAAEGRFRLVTRNLDNVLSALAEAPLHMDAILTSDEHGDAATVSRITLTASWQGRDILTAPTLLAGIGMYHLRWILARTLAIVRCRQVNRTHLTGRDLMDAWAVVHMLFRNRSVRGVVEGYADEIGSVLGLGLPTLIAARQSLVRLDPQSDIYLY